MEYSFTAWGHENITGKHKRTLEFTKDNELRVEGDCILGVSSNFSVYDLKDVIKEALESNKKIKMIIKVGDVIGIKNSKNPSGISDEVVFEPNPDFNDEKEIVVRKGDFISDRTFGVKADKACIDLNKDLIKRMGDPEQEIIIMITLK